MICRTFPSLFCGFVSALLLLSFAGCDAPKPNQLTILYTGDTVGELEYCGCSTEPIGGIARRARYISEVRKKESRVLVLDAGNIFGNADLMGRLKGEVLLQAMGEMAYDALNLSNKEFLYGASTILDGAAANSIPAVSANVVVEETSEHVSVASHTVVMDLLRIGIVGIVAKEFEDDVLESNGINNEPLALTEEVPALRAEVARLKDGVDFIVILASTGLEGANAIAEEVDGIHVIVVGQGSQITAMPRLVNGVSIVKAGYFGQTIGRLDILFDDDNLPVEATGEIVNLNKDIDEDETVLELLDDFHRGLVDYKDELFDIEEQTPSEGGRYVGAEACKTCHGTAHRQWETTAHAHAISSLEATGQDYNPECVDCHVTGFRYSGGFKRADLTPEMVNVQCEVCHGARQEHVDSDGMVPGAPLPDEITCRTCHTGARSPKFDYRDYYQMIRH